MHLSELQEMLGRTYLERDASRGPDRTFRWLVEEVGELAKALRHGEHDQVVHELGDVLAWLGSLANVVGIDLEEAAERYATGCPKCGRSPCMCQMD